MIKRPYSLSAIGWLFVAVGCVALVAGFLPLVRTGASGRTAEFGAHDAVDLGIVCVSALLAVLGGAFLLRGCKWARWLLVAWMGFHLPVSLLHSQLELLMHSLVFAPIVYLLFRPRATAFLRATPSETE